MRLQQVCQSGEIAGADHLRRSGRPSGGNREMNGAVGQFWSAQVAGRDEGSGIVRSHGNFILVSELLQLRSEAGERGARVLRADENTTAGFEARRAMQFRLAGDWAARRQAANVNQLIGAGHFDDAFEAACAGPLLGDEGNSESAVQFRGIEATEEFDKCGIAKAIADSRRCLQATGHLIERAVYNHGTEQVGAGAANFRGGTRANIHIHVVDVGEIRRMETPGLKMDGEAGGDAGDPFARGSLYFDGLRGVEFVEQRKRAALREALELNVAIVGDATDDEAGLVHGRDDETMGRAAADRHYDVAEVVGLGREGCQALANEL